MKQTEPETNVDDKLEQVMYGSERAISFPAYLSFHVPRVRGYPASFSPRNFTWFGY